MPLNYRQFAADPHAVALPASRDAAPVASPLPLASRPWPLAPPRGISLLEVLIAMFVMLFGLMGVAAIFPLGNHYAGRGEQFDRAAALAGSAFAEIKARELLRPAFWGGGVCQSLWRYPDNSLVFADNGTFRLGVNGGHAFVIDPLGGAAAAASTAPSAAANAGTFPYGAALPNTSNQWDQIQPPTSAWPIARVTLPVNRFAPNASIPIPRETAETYFRLHDDLTVELPRENDRPGMQRWAMNNNGTPNNPYDDIPVSRAYVGSYSWIATVVPTNRDAYFGMMPANPRFGSFLYDVSVAVFYKREIDPSVDSNPNFPGTDSERALQAELGPGGNLVLYSNLQNSALDNSVAVNAALDNIRPGQWIALTGVHPTSHKVLLYWYRLLSIDDETDDVFSLNNASVTYIGRNAMVEGPNWPTEDSAPVAQDLRAILLPGVIGVTTRTMKLDVN